MHKFERKGSDMRRNKLLMERNGKMVAEQLGVCGANGAGGRCWVCNAQVLLQGALPKGVACGVSKE